MDKDYSFRVWDNDYTGFTLQGTVKTGCCLCPTTENMYRYEELLTLPRDAANRFYENPYMHMVGVQRVVVVDEDAGEVMICTPARAAAWMILRNRGVQDAVVTEVNSLDNITQRELDNVLLELRSRRGGTIRTNAEDNRNIPSRIIIREGNAKGDGHAKQWELTGFAENGGWAKFFGEVMTEGNRWMAVIEGRTSSPQERIMSEKGKYDLVFKDIEVELLYGEGRRFTANNEEILGVQLRRGYCVIRPGVSEQTQVRFDQFILPQGLSKGVYSQETRELRSGHTWRIRPDQALTHYTIGEDIMTL